MIRITRTDLLPHLKTILNIMFIVVSLVYVGYGVATIVAGGEPGPFALYIPIYAFMYGQAPATFALIVLIVFLWPVRTTNEGSLKTEIRFFLASVAALMICLLSIWMTEALR